MGAGARAAVFTAIAQEQRGLAALFGAAGPGFREIAIRKGGKQGLVHAEIPVRHGIVTGERIAQQAGVALSAQAVLTMAGIDRKTGQSRGPSQDAAGPVHLRPCPVKTMPWM